MSPAELDVLINGAFVYERPDGTRYATWTNMARFGVEPIARSGALTADELSRPSSEVLARLNESLAA